MGNKLVVDGCDAIFGRMSSFVAKELLKGNFVEIINCEKIIFSGKKDVLVEKINTKRIMGKGSSLKGPKYIRQEDKLVKRMVRGMLPRDRMKGQEAFKRLRCYIGNGNLKEDVLKNAISFNHKKPQRYSTVKEIIGDLK